VSFQIDVSQLDAINFGTIYNLCAIYLNVIEIYVYLNKLESIVCYLVHKSIPVIYINLLILHILYFLLFEKNISLISIH